MSRLVFELYFPRISEIWGGQIDTFDTFELARFDQVSIFVGGAAIIQEVVFQLCARCRAAYWWFSSCVQQDVYGVRPWKNRFRNRRIALGIALGTSPLPESRFPSSIIVDSTFSWRIWGKSMEHRER